MIIVKFENHPTTRDKEILCEITKNKEVEIIFIQSFYHKKFYSLLQQVVRGGGAFDGLLAFNIDLQDYSKEAIKQVCLANRNCYTLFFNPYELRQYSFLFKCREINLEKYIIEYGYKNHWIEKPMRNFMHSFERNVAKTDFFMDRRLYNLSESWEIVGLKSNKHKSLQLHFPKVIYIGLLNVCNINCPLCPWFSLAHIQTQTNDYFKTKKQLSNDKVYEILDFASRGKSKVVFSGPGEPLLDSRLLEFVKKAKNLGIKQIELATNGVLLNEKTFQDLLNAGVQFFDIVISFAKEVYDKCDTDFFRHYQKTLKKLANICDDSAHRAKMKLSVCCYERESLGKALEFFLQFKEYSNVECQIAYLDANVKCWDGSQINNLRHTCSAPFASLYIFPDGSVGFCKQQRAWLGRERVDNFCIGNVYQENLEQIWQGKLHQKMQQRHLNLSFDKICETCGSWWNEAN